MAKKIRKLRLAVKVYDREYGGEDWEFTIEEPMPATVDIVEYTGARLSEELKRHMKVIPDELKPLKLESGDSDDIVNLD